MTTFNFGDIVLVPFPFTNQSAIKKRPAVIISSNEYNHNRPDIVLMAVTSQMRSADFYGDQPVKQWQQAGLLKPSVIKPICTTIEKRLVLKTLGRLQKQDMTVLDETLQIILGQ
ncbi:type II toxin-antitoxin system PemK/MazF family toxin [uncultured Desulfosarcina sp.]|uniref:type II toxin-antitoxin system PemK/MazF family toxin n=1 Tax=uncultured Desulfosarcina sp. TaxID=218289 RepID=UPI0029C6AA5A|nr:type II toxin-antitoxin system PemK/MazF family toxin [uncultured Desulfosarcina sp.]